MGRCRRDRGRRRRVQQPERDLLTYTALSGNTAAASFHVIGVLCRSRISIGSFTLGAVGLICLFVFALPWSPSTQPSGFSVTLDLDDAAGDQAVSSLDLLPDQLFPSRSSAEIFRAPPAFPRASDTIRARLRSRASIPARRCRTPMLTYSRIPLPSALAFRR